MIGVTQEQHPNRCRVFAQWKGIDWPILWDPFNMTGSKVVPRYLLIDEHGVVQSTGARPDDLAAFLTTAYPAVDAKDPPAGSGLELFEATMAKKGSPEAAYYGALSNLLWNTGNGDKAMLALKAYARERPDDAEAQWRLGVAFRMRYDSLERHDGDFQLAIDHWRRGIDLDPRHYIYRRRLQQYGPRLHKPYPFYSWVDEARAALGESAPPLIAPLTRSERAGPRAGSPAAQEAREPDPKNEIESLKKLMDVETAVAWSDRGDGVARAHVVLRPSGRRVLLWDAEAGPVTIWLRLPEGWRTESNLLTYTLTGEDRAEEQVVVDFELHTGKPAAGTIQAYALYYACLDGPGECRYLRHDFEIAVPAPR